MPLITAVGATFNVLVESGNITYSTDATVTPASGAPGAYKQLRSNAAATVAWWFCALVLGNVSAAGATRFDFQIARVQDGSGSDIANTLSLLLEAATATVNTVRHLPFPVKVNLGVGAAARQTTASTKTLDVAALFATNVGS